MDKKEFVLQKLKLGGLDKVAYEAEVSRKTLYNIMKPNAKMSEGTLDKLYAYYKPAKKVKK